MKTFVLLLSAAFLGLVAAYPRIPISEVQPIAALYDIRHGRMIPLHQYLTPMDFIVPVSESRTMSTEFSREIPLEDEPKFIPSEEESVVGARSRRSTQPGANVPQGGGQSGGSSDRGQVDVSVSRGEGGGRRVEARGEGNVWQSNDGRGRVDVHGHYSRDYGGRYGTGRPEYGGGIRYSHRF
ncbi:uncharacterized protein [Hetaerina americana]|uniref:uncharacterized protein n=1 Tax=Hetaerina americana TaxID=62018 RepID=UPI003A7F269D